MAINELMRGAACVAVIGASAAALAGCVSSPTYGTDRTATSQLFDDLGAAATIRPQRGNEIVHTPRPDLVTPPSTTNLPPPQTSVAASEQWPESPEETRERLRAQADLTGRPAPGFASRTTMASGAPNPPIVGGHADGPPPPGSQNDPQSQQRFRAAQQQQLGGNPGQRAFLSEPPLDYRRPAETAPVGELGESERAKESRRQQMAQRPGQRRWWPF